MPHRSGWTAAALAALRLPGLAGCAPRVVPAGPPVAAPALAEDAILAADGARLRLHHRAPPEGRPVR
ncbi:hypothetical protein, partial [Teichococcus aestuarii]